MSATTTAVKERPILFSGPMVRAILEGRKTQTRRAVKPQPSNSATRFVPAISGEHWIERLIFDARLLGLGVAETNGTSHRCPFAPVGSQLWVREGARQLGHERTGRNGQYLWPKFDDPENGRRWFDQNCFYTADDHSEFDDEPQGTLNKLFMPRWASRLTLAITRVRVERLQDISLDDCWAEGTQIPVSPDGRVLLQLTGKHPPCDYLRPIDAPAGETHSCDEIARAHFASLWDSINAKRGLAWAANPWVWAIDFKRLTRPAEKGA